MLKSFLFAAAVAMSAAPAAAQQAPPQSQTLAAQYAQGMQSLVGKKFEGDITIQGIAAEANTLVIAIDGPKGWRAQLSPAEISGALVEGFCGTAPQFFTNGVTMRIDSLDGGELQKGPLVSSCPPAKPE